VRAATFKGITGNGADKKIKDEQQQLTRGCVSHVQRNYGPWELNSLPKDSRRDVLERKMREGASKNPIKRKAYL